MTTASFGKSIKLFLVDGTTSGLWSAEVSASWTGRMFRVSKATFDSLNEFEDASGPGVYFLIGEVEESGKRQLYIGESDNVLNRLLQHDNKGEKTFWKDTILVVSKDDNLTKAHNLYLESRLIEIATKAGQVRLTNGTNPSKKLPRPDQSDMEYFIAQILLMVPVLGYTFLAAISPTPQVTTSSSFPEFEFEIGNVKATMQVRSDQQFVVLADSQAFGTEKQSLNSGYTALRAKLVDDGILVRENCSPNYVFSRDTPFASPSRAAVVVYGGIISGPKYWRLKGTGQAYGEWLEAQARRSIPDAPEPADAAEAEPAAVEVAVPIAEDLDVA